MLWLFIAEIATRTRAQTESQKINRTFKDPAPAGHTFVGRAAALEVGALAQAADG